MKRTALLSSFGVLATLLFGDVSPVEAHRHATGGHPKHLWNEDARAYRSFREMDRLEAGAREFAHRGSFAPVSGIERIDGVYLESSLRILAGEKDPVLTNRAKKEGRAAARSFLAKEFEAYGFKTHEESYGSGVNLVAERTGSSGKFLVVSAHYDSVSNPGADDDATGVAAMLGTAKMLADRELTNGVRFVAFDEEEVGLVGSSAYVKALIARGEKEATLGNLQMEMMGYNAKKNGKFHVISCDRPDSQFLVDTFAAVVAKAGTGISITTACTDRSDHSSFWRKGIPAVVISENFFGGDSNPCYHRSCDKTDLVNFTYLRNVAEAAANVVIQIATNEARDTPTPPAPPTNSGSSWPSFTR